MEFVNLNETNIEQDVVPAIKFTPTEQTEQELKTFSLDNKELAETNEDSLCVKDCECGSTIKCSDKTGYFLVDNLFGELKTEYDKLIARTNLGIGTDQALQWGNILGNLANQLDLVKFVNEQIDVEVTKAYDELNQRIDDLGTESNKTTLYYGGSLNSLTKSETKTFTTGNYSGNIYVLVPNANPSFIVNGLSGGFEQIDIQTINNTLFYTFKSVYSNLGITTITVSYG